MSSNPNFPILVDQRIGSVELVKYLHIPAEVSMLRFGDVSFGGWGPEDEVWSIGIERKTIRDLATSIQTGRLSGHQLIGLLEWYHVVYLLVEGAFRVHNNVIEVGEGRHWKPLQGKLKTGHMFGYMEIANYLNTLSVVTGVHVWFTDSLEMSAEWIRHTYYWWQKKYSEHRAHLDFVQGPIPPKRMRLVRPTLVQRILKELPGVGWEKAGELATHFPTMEEVMIAKPEDFIKVPGIGKILAASIYKELHRK